MCARYNTTPQARVSVPARSKEVPKIKTLLATFIISAVVAVIITPLVRKFAPKIGAVDLPSGRRVNKKVIPRLGGIAILLGFLAPLVGLMLYSNRISEAFIGDLSRVIALFAGSVAIAALGAVDDIKGTKAIYKLMVQIVIAVGAYFGGFQISYVNLPFIGSLDMGIFALPVTVLWIVGIINAVNLIDGLDGLAAGVAFFVCIVNFTIGLLSNNILVAVYAAALGGALVGFLVFNFNPATIFMGDTGSMLIGYILATTSLIGSKGGTAVALLVPIMAMGVPIFDTLLAVVRRYLSKQPIFSPDKGHIHHRLLDMGLTHKKTVLVLYGLSMLFTIAAISIYIGRDDWKAGVSLLAATVLIFVMMRAVGIFQLRKMKQKQIIGDFDETTKAMMKALPTYIIKSNNATTDNERRVALEQFCIESGLLFATCKCEENAEHFLKDWVWEESNGRNSLGRGYVSAKYPTKDQHNKTNILLKFGWSSEDATVCPQVDILLRIVTKSLRNN